MAMGEGINQRAKGTESPCKGMAASSQKRMNRGRNTEKSVEEEKRERGREREGEKEETEWIRTVCYSTN